MKGNQKISSELIWRELVPHLSQILLLSHYMESRVK